MTKNIFDSAADYVAIIELIEQTSDLEVLQKLEEKRIQYHWQFMDVLKKQGILFKDREHATRIAFKIVKGEL